MDWRPRPRTEEDLRGTDGSEDEVSKSDFCEEKGDSFGVAEVGRKDEEGWEDM